MAQDSEALTTVRFALDDQGRVVAIDGGVRTILGPRDAVAEEMGRFLAEINSGDP